MIVDTFMFFNELDILLLRLKELDEIVDRFVLLECAEALSGVHKPFIFDEHKHRFEPYLSRIKHIKLPGLPPLLSDTEANRFWLERFQRDALMLGLIGEGLNDDDIILLSDVDEIPRLDSVKRLVTIIQDNEVWIFKQKFYYRYLDFPTKREPTVPWLGTVAVRYNAFGRIRPHDLRRSWAKAGEYWTPVHEADQSRHFVEDGGWHLTYFGSKAAYDYKTANFAHGASGGINGTYPDPRRTLPATVSREADPDVKPFDDGVYDFLMEYIRTELSGDVPSGIVDELQSFYHLFASSRHKRP